MSELTVLTDEDILIGEDDVVVMVTAGKDDAMVEMVTGKFDDVVVMVIGRGDDVTGACFSLTPPWSETTIMFCFLAFLSLSIVNIIQCM